MGCKREPPKVDQLAGRAPTLCAPPVFDDNAWYEKENRAPLLSGLGTLHFPVTTKSELAQKYFDQGLVLAYGFNHAEAARSFYYAAKLDSTCAMAHWGFAYALGPNYNGDMAPENYDKAHSAIQKAIKLADRTNSKEQFLIEALSKRYPKNFPDDPRVVDRQYAKAMEKVYRRFPKDPDIVTLYIDALMNEHPWNLWDETGAPQPWTPKILKLFDQAFLVGPKHVGAHHLYIHAVEASKNPEKGLASAQLFDEGLVPGVGHLVHMPSHIYIRTGDYHKATKANLKAIAVDSAYYTTCHAQGIYPLTSYPHNYHFMAAAATLEGNSELALMAVDKVSAHALSQLKKLPDWELMQHYYTMPYFVYTKFGKWHEILAMKEESSMIYPKAMRHYARGMAHLGLNDIANAKREWEFLQQYTENKELKSEDADGASSIYYLMTRMASGILVAEIMASEGNYEASIDTLKKIVELEDLMNYEEPPDWFCSVRHHLGAVQNEAGHYDDAIQTFQEDFEKYPKNGWSLHGLQLAYTKLNDQEKARQITERLASTWTTADVQLTNARLK